MIPILFETNSTEFNNNGLGGLSDVISCNVTEERNGSYELEMEYPINGIHFDEITSDRIILAKPNETDDRQAFRIYALSKPIDGIITINAEHISYQMNYIPVLQTFECNSAAAAIGELKAKVAVSNPFNLSTDISQTSSNTFKVFKPQSLKNCLVGGENSVLSLYGGEFKYDNFDVELRAKRGSDNGVKIAYGKNLVDVKQEENISEIVTGVASYWSKDNETVLLADKIYKIPNSATYSYERIIPVDLTNEFDDDNLSVVDASGTKKPTQEQLKQKTIELYQNRKDLSIPKVDLTVDFVNLGDCEEYEEFKNLERVSLCDTVTVEFKKLGVDAKSKVVKTEFDVLKEKYNKIELSSTENVSSSVAYEIAKQSQEIENNKSFLQSAIEKATKDITGNSGGFVVLYPPRNPQEILIMNTDNPNTATDVWRWNSAGLAHGKSYNGPFNDIAITASGSINGRMIAAGTIEAGSISGDFISADKIAAKNGLTIEDTSKNAVIIGTTQMTITRQTPNYARVGFQNDGIFIGKAEKTNTIALWLDGSADFASGKFTINSDGSLDLSNSKIKFFEDGSAEFEKTASFLDGKVYITKKGEIICRGTNGTDVINVSNFLESLNERVSALENK